MENLFKLIIFSCQQHAKSCDPNLSIEEKKEIIAEVAHYHDVINRQLKSEPNGELIKELWRNLACSMTSNQMYRSFVDAAGLDEEMEWHGFENYLELEDCYEMISWDDHQHLDN